MCDMDLHLNIVYISLNFYMLSLESLFVKVTNTNLSNLSQSEKLDLCTMPGLQVTGTSPALGPPRTLEMLM